MDRTEFGVQRESVLYLVCSVGRQPGLVRWVGGKASSAPSEMHANVAVSLSVEV